MTSPLHSDHRHGRQVQDQYQDQDPHPHHQHPQQYEYRKHQSQRSQQLESQTQHHHSQIPPTRPSTTAHTTQQFPSRSSSFSPSYFPSPPPSPSPLPSQSSHPSSSELLKRNRRCCGGIFVPVEEADEPGVVRYAWPQSVWPYQDEQQHDSQQHHQDQDQVQYRRQLVSSDERVAALSDESIAALRRHAINSSNDAGRTDESFFDAECDLTADTEGFSGGKGRMKDDFERDVEFYGSAVSQEDDPEKEKGEPVLNLATRDGISTRSLSVYSQSSQDEEHERIEVGSGQAPDGRAEEHPRCPRASRLRRVGAFSALPRTRYHTAKDTVSLDFNDPVNREKAAVSAEARSLRSISSCFSSMRNLSDRLGARRADLTDSITERFGKLKIRKLKT